MLRAFAHPSRVLPIALRLRYLQQPVVRAASSYGASGDRYAISAEAKAAFHRDGYVTLPKFLTEEELAPIEAVYNALMQGDEELVQKMQRDYCDMSQGFDVKPADFRIVNAMLPRIYKPSLQGSVYERRAADVVHQLYEGKFGIDYDQLLDKRPMQPKAVFAWHQDVRAGGGGRRGLGGRRKRPGWAQAGAA